MRLYAVALIAANEMQTPSPESTIGTSLVSILLIISMWLIYKKAGEHGWAAIIPFYSTYVLFKITWGNGWRFLLLLIPIYNIVLYIQTMIKLAHAYEKSTAFGWGLVFLNVIFSCILAFGDAQYEGTQA